MKKAIVVVWCVAVCLTLITGCVSFVGGGSVQPDKQAKADNTNLLVKIDIEKNGSVVDYLSSVVYKDTIIIAHSFKEKDASIDEGIIFNFSGRNIRKTSEDSYLIDYSVDLKIPIATGNMNNDGRSANRSFQYTSATNISSINLKLGQPVYIYASNTYKVKLTIDTMK